MQYENAYCVFCRSGAENRLAQEIEQRFNDVKAIVAVAEKHRLRNGQEEIDRQILLPGYFLYANERIDTKLYNRLSNLYKVLATDDKIVELQGSDKAFAHWLYIHNGIIGISKLRFENGILKSIKGPMEYFAKKILKIDKHTCNAMVRMDFQGRQTDKWPAFEFADDSHKDSRFS